MFQCDIWGLRPTPAKTAEKAENHSKEGPINTTIGKSGAMTSHIWPYVFNEPEIPNAN